MHTDHTHIHSDIYTRSHRHTHRHRCSHTQAHTETQSHTPTNTTVTIHRNTESNPSRSSSRALLHKWVFRYNAYTPYQTHTTYTNHIHMYHIRHHTTSLTHLHTYTPHITYPRLLSHEPGKQQCRLKNRGSATCVLYPVNNVTLMMLSAPPQPGSDGARAASWGGGWRCLPGF